MTLFNARLGWWLGNPAQLRSGSLADRVGWYVDHLIQSAADSSPRLDFEGQTYHLSSPRHSLRPLIDEALGRTSDDNEYVYLSDGGHFENLGLYEMVRRRCHCVVVVDATFDPTGSLEGLGNAIRKIRIDLGIPITFDHIPMNPQDGDGPRDKLCTIGTIAYSAVDAAPATDGVLVYLKPFKEHIKSVDVYNYGRARGLFPNESTANQWFSESQFESYRRLGQEIVDRICARARQPGGSATDPDVWTLEEFVAAAQGTRAESSAVPVQPSDASRGTADAECEPSSAPPEQSVSVGLGGRTNVDAPPPPTPALPAASVDVGRTDGSESPKLPSEHGGGEANPKERDPDSHPGGGVVEHPA
jgi:hypothetical protein